MRNLIFCFWLLACSRLYSLEPEHYCSMPVSVNELLSISSSIEILGTFYSPQMVVGPEYAYLMTAQGVTRTELPITGASIFESTAMSGTGTSAIAISDNGELYVSKIAGGLLPEGDTFFVSNDNGDSFQVYDEGLTSCFELRGREYCEYLNAEQILIASGRVYSNAGGGRNVHVKTDSGWIPLQGSLTQQACTAPAFEISGNKLWVGGECPLDDAFIEYGVLSEDGLSLEIESSEIEVDGFENRNVQFIKDLKEKEVVIAGVEGGIIRSTDGGETFEFALRYGSNEPAPFDEKYPYVQHVLQPEAYPDLTIVGGFNKATFPNETYLAVSWDSGESWTDLSSMLQLDPSNSSDVDAIIEQANGSILILTNELADGSNQDYKLRIFEMDVQRPMEHWRFDYFGQKAPVGNAANDADPDHDMRTNLREYIEETHPLVADSGHLPIGLEMAGDDWHFTVKLPQGAYDIYLEGQHTSDLAEEWTSSTQFDIIDYEWRYSFPAIGDSRFFRGIFEETNP